jgi:hypothetical protein
MRLAIKFLCYKFWCRLSLAPIKHEQSQYNSIADEIQGSVRKNKRHTRHSEHAIGVQGRSSLGRLRLWIPAQGSIEDVRHRVSDGFNRDDAKSLLHFRGDLDEVLFVFLWDEHCLDAGALRG